MMKTVSEAAKAFAPSIKSIVKLALQSRKATITHARMADAPEPLVIMGNGPSLNLTLEQYAEQLAHATTMAVNFAANAPIFTQLKPRYYILADPHFFTGADDANLNKLTDSLAAVSWPMTLIIPAIERKKVPAKISSNPHIKIATINALGIEGWQWLTRMAYSSGRGMPRPRNVLIAAIMAGAQMGYKEIYVVGADHSWMSTISVNERNEVISVQPHFYKDDDKEVKRINTAYLNYPLHQIVHSFYVAFKAYHDIADYARHRGINIYNATPESMIDAFERRPLPF